MYFCSEILEWYAHILVGVYGDLQVVIFISADAKGAPFHASDMTLFRNMCMFSREMTGELGSPPYSNFPLLPSFVLNVFLFSTV